jgi:6-phosphofructokinase
MNISPSLPIRGPKEITPFIQRMKDHNLCLAILHAGGPAPGGNRVIAAAAKFFLDRGVRVIGIKNGYEFIQNGKPFPLAVGEHYIEITSEIASDAVDQNALVIRTSRANPGKEIETPEDLEDPGKTKLIRNVLDVFEMLRVGALVSIGGDDTLKTANFVYQISTQILIEDPDRLFQAAVVHVPKTIDNDYYGIPWTFGFWTAAEAAGKEIRGFYDDAKATNCYHVVECMGRKAGWYTAAASMFGRATKALLPEEYESVPEIDIDELARELIQLVIKREGRNKHYGVITVAEGLADKLPKEIKKAMRDDRHGNPRLPDVEIGVKLAEALENEYEKETSRKKSFKPQKVGYETRQKKVGLFDALLTSQLGIGAARLIENENFGEMVTVRDDLDPAGIKFGELIDPKTLKVKSRNIDRGGAFYALLRASEEEI